MSSFPITSGITISPGMLPPPPQEEGSSGEPLHMMNFNVSFHIQPKCKSLQSISLEQQN